MRGAAARIGEKEKRGSGRRNRGSVFCGGEPGALSESGSGDCAEKGQRQVFAKVSGNGAAGDPEGPEVRGGFAGGKGRALGGGQARRERIGEAPPSETEGGAPGCRTRGGRETMNTGIVVRKCAALEEYQACVELQREIWGEADLEVEPVTMFVVASITGGQVLGAFDGQRLVGYTLALVGLRENRIYLHSHQTGVCPEYRDRGVGRMLKLFQREEALGIP